MSAIKQGLVLVASVATFTMGLAYNAAPASAAPSCGGQSTVFGGGASGEATGDCTQGGPGAVGYVNPDADVATWVKFNEYPDQVCTDRNGNPSFRADMYGIDFNGNRIPGRTFLNYCLTQHAGGGQPTLAQAKLVVQAPTIEADFKGDFLIGTEVKFNFTQPGAVQQAIPNFNAYIEARPASYLWDFGDGTTSTEASPTHVYTNKDVSPDEIAHVTVDVTYEAFLLASDAAGIAAQEQNLGEIQLSSRLDRRIVEVWSALTPQEAR